MLELNFLPNVADQEQGLADAGIETFRDTPFSSVARECGQNSADARATSPVRVAFDEIEIPITDLPSYEQYRCAVASCLNKARKAKNEKETDFFTSAESLLNSDNIKILRISDYNTTGLSGPCTPGTPFHSLLKATGVSTEKLEDSGGSFGIGKNAAFAVSGIQTVFYSTLYTDNQSGQEQFLCQGKSILVSHSNEEGEPRLAQGYWGEDKYQPVTSINAIPDWLKRDETGTSLYCIGFKDVKDWQARITASLLQNFFCAIYRKEMEFSINNEITINKDSVVDLFRNKKYTNAAEDSGHYDDYIFSRDLLDCLTTIESRIETLEIPNLGKVSIRVLVREGLSKRIGFIRNGMYITDNLGNFGHKFLKFPMYKEFVAFVEPEGKEGSSLLKKLENPRHDSFSAERLTDPVKRRQAFMAMKKLGDRIREVIRSHAIEKPKNSTDLNELSEFFADEVDPEEIQDPDALENNPEKPVYITIKPDKPSSPVTSNDDGNKGGTTGLRGKGGSKDRDGPSRGEGNGGTGNKSHDKTLIIDKIRSLVQHNDAAFRRIFFTPKTTTPALISFFATGINTREIIPLKTTSSGKISGHSLLINLTAETRTNLDVEFMESYDGPIELVCKSHRENKNEDK